MFAVVHEMWVQDSDVTLTRERLYRLALVPIVGAVV